MKALASGIVAVVAIASCSSEAPLNVPAGCQPLEGDLSCTLPFPSDFFRAGNVVALTGAAKPQTPAGVDADIVTPLGVDGFSRQPSIACVLPDAVVADGLPGINDNALRSMDPTQSPTLLIEADTGQLLAHYADVDPVPDDATHVVLSIKPLVQLAPATRYVVALTGVKNAGRSLAAPAEGFRRMRDHDTSQDPSLGPVEARFDTDVFPVLEKIGVARSTLQLAWDFTTASQSTAESDMLALRSLVQAWLDQTPSPQVTITTVSPGAGDYFRDITGTITVPLYVESDQTGALLHRDASGKIAQNGTAEVPFRIVVPRTVVQQWGAGRGLAFGHGFFGTVFGDAANPGEIDQDYTQVLLSGLTAVTFATDWWGMSKADLGTVIGLISATPGQAHQFVERVYQAMANWMVITRAMRTSFAAEPALHRPLAGDGVIVRSDGTTNAGALLYDPTAVYYFGASLGHILGSIMTSLNPDVERAVLEVGGASYEQIMPRSTPFAGFNFFIKSAMQTELGAQTYEAMMASALDRIDPATYAPYLIGSGLAGNPDRKVLLQAGIGDAEVPNCATYFQARALGISMVQPTPQATYGVPLAPAAGLTSALTTWDFGVSADVYKVASPTADNPVHVGLRNVPSAIAQMDAFLRSDGTVIYPCPTEGWCHGQ